MIRHPFRGLAAPGAALGLLLPVAAQDDGPDRASDLARLCQALGAEARAAGAHGLAFCVDGEGELADAGGSGYTDDTRTVVADAEARFRVGALLPTFLGVAALQLAEDGRLDLAAPLGECLPDLRLVPPPVSLDQLLTHTSGLPSYGDWLEAEGRLAQAFDGERVLAWLAGAPRDAEPGTCVAYSPSNDFLLGRVLAALSERTPRALLEERVFAAAGMADTAWCETGPLLFPRAPLEQDLADGFRDARGVPAPFEAEALCSTARDLVRFQRALVEGRLLGPERLRLRSTPAELAGRPTGSARGIALASLDELACQHAGGGLAGYRVSLAYYPALDATVVVVASGVDVPTRALGASVARVLFARQRPGVRDLALEPARRARYVGEYYAGCTSYSIAEQGAGLVLFHPSGTRHPLRHQGGERFVSGLDPELELDFELEEGRVIVLVLTDHGVTLRARRVT